MKPTPVLTALLFLIAWNTQSQVTTYNIGNYKLPEVTWQALETSVGIMGDNRFQKYSSPSESQSSIFSGNLNLNYRYFRNTESLQRSFQAVASSNAHFENSSVNELNFSSRAFNPMVYLNSENRIYFRNKYFYEINSEVRYGHDYFKEELEIDILGPEIQSNHAFAIAIPLKIGYGRIEPVQDARQAIYILDELSRVGRGADNISEQEVVELANRISRLRNKRFLDPRLGWMEQIESLDSLLRANDHITLQDARYFTTLADMWNYGNYPQRSSGNRISLALYPQYNLYDYHRTPSDETEVVEYQINQIQLNTGIEFVHEKPLNLYWQNSIYAHAYYTYRTQQRTNQPDTRTPGMEAKLGHQIGYYPNTRTEMTLNNSLTYDTTNDKVDGAQFKLNNFIFDSSFRIHYYFSPQLQIGGYSIISYNRNRHSFFFADIEGEPIKYRQFSHRFSIEVIYKIF